MSYKLQSYKLRNCVLFSSQFWSLASNEEIFLSRFCLDLEMYTFFTYCTCLLAFIEKNKATNKEKVKQKAN